jgi:hypothetical protein
VFVVNHRRRADTFTVTNTKELVSRGSQKHAPGCQCQLFDGVFSFSLATAGCAGTLVVTGGKLIHGTPRATCRRKRIGGLMDLWIVEWLDGWFPINPLLHKSSNPMSVNSIVP